MSFLFGRKIGLIAYNPPTFSSDIGLRPASGLDLGQGATDVGTTTPGKGLDLSNMHIVFKVYQSDIETPNYATIRVYNLSTQTAQSLKGEFQKVILQAGYDYPNGTGVIFNGNIKQVLFGHESNVDSYADIIAADGDAAYNNAVCSASIAAGQATSAAQLQAILQAMKPYGITQGYTLDMPVTALSRGKILFGLARDSMRDLSNSVGASWSIQNGQLTMIPLTDYLPGEAVVLGSTSGLVGFPEQTPGGINARSLLNPRLKIGALVQIKAENINQGVIATSGPILLPNSGRLENMPSQGFIAKISGAGYYKVLVAEHSGDTRGQDWYTDLTCLAADPSAPPGQRVNPNYAGAAYNAPADSGASQ